MSPSTFLFSLIVTLTAGAALVLGLGSAPPVQHERRTREFQELVGGLGLGPAVDLSSCAFAFDPRLCPTCPQDYGPIPCGAGFCPRHGCSIFSYPPLPEGRITAD
jgi:hypothetical protein